MGQDFIDDRYLRAPKKNGADLFTGVQWAEPIGHMKADQARVLVIDDETNMRQRPFWR